MNYEVTWMVHHASDSSKRSTPWSAAARAAARDAALDRVALLFNFNRSSNVGQVKSKAASRAAALAAALKRVEIIAMAVRQLLPRGIFSTTPAFVPLAQCSARDVN